MMKKYRWMIIVLGLILAMLLAFSVFLTALLIQRIN